MSEAPDDDLPLDDWHNYVYMVLAVECEHCGVAADLDWDGLPASDAGARAFTVRAVRYLKREDWRLEDRGPCCPACSKRDFPSPE